MSAEDKREFLQQLEQKMFEAASEMEFEKAAEYRDRIDVLNDNDAIPVRYKYPQKGGKDGKKNKINQLKF